MDFNINNETFANAYKCLSDANTLLEAGLGNFNELEGSALKLIGKNGIENNSRLDLALTNCQGLKENMGKTIRALAEINVESADYFQDFFSSYSIDFEFVDYGSEEHLAYVRQFAKNSAYQNVGPSGLESWCPLNVSNLVDNMEELYGYSNLEATIREDGVRVLSGTDPNGQRFEDLVIVAADVYHEKENPGGTYQRGEIVETSLGTGIVIDLCERAMNERKSGGPVWFDIYAAFWEKPYVSMIYGKN